MDDVDVFVGLVSETHVPGALVGPTLACLLGSQFRDIKFGDRFFYETRGQEEGFTEGRCLLRFNFFLFSLLWSNEDKENNEQGQQLLCRFRFTIKKSKKIRVSVTTLSSSVTLKMGEGHESDQAELTKFRINKVSELIALYRQGTQQQTWISNGEFTWHASKYKVNKLHQKVPEKM